MLLQIFIVLVLKTNQIFCNIIIDYLNHNHVEDAVYFQCSEENIFDKIHTILTKSPIRITVGDDETMTVTKNNSNKIGFILDLNCHESEIILSEASDLKMFTDLNYWLILSRKNLSIITEMLSRHSLDIVSEVKIALKITDTYYEIYDAYNSGLNRNGVFNISRVGFWSENLGYKLDVKWKYARRFDLFGARIRVPVVVLHQPKNTTFMQFLLSDSNTHIDSMHRFHYRLVLLVKEIYNFDIQLIRTESWGYNHNGTFDGMIGMLQRREADLAGSPAFWRLERANVADGLVQTWDNRPVFIFRHPKATGSFWSIFTRPLDDKVWYCSLAFNLLVSLLLYALYKYNCKRYPGDNIEDNYSFAVLGIFAAVCQQGLDLNTRLTTIKMVIFTLFLSSLLLYQYYSASIVSALLKEPPITIRTLEDLLSSHLKIGMDDSILYNIDYFKRTQDPIAIKLYKTKISTEKHTNYFDSDEGMGRVKKGGFAYLGDLPVVYKYIRDHFEENEICDLVEINLFPAQRMMTSAQKGLPFKKLLTIGFRRLQEHGLMDHETKKWLIPKPKCVKNPENLLFAVTLREFSTALIILACGMMLSFAILLFEMISFQMDGKVDVHTIIASITKRLRNIFK